MIKFFIDQIKAINILVIFILAVGTYFFATGQKEGFPNIGFDAIVVLTAYPGLSSQEVEANVTRKLEEKIDTIEGKDKMLSFSSEGLSRIIFQIDPDLGIPNSTVLSDIKEAVDLAKPDLPSDASDPTIQELTFQNISPIVRLGISGDYTTDELKEQVDYLYDKMTQISGVGKIEKVDYPEKQVWIEVIPSKLELYDLQISDVENAINDNNITLPAGNVTIGDKEYLVKTQNKFLDLNDIGDTIVRGNDIGQVVLVKDIANVSYGTEELSTKTRIEGQSGMWLNLFQSKTGDVITIVDEAKNIVKKSKENGAVKGDLKIVFIDDLSFYVKRRLGILTQNATVGLLLVFACLIIFFPLKVTLWTTLGIPFSFCLAIIGVYQMGFTLNLMSMFGFIIVLGMIVDDAIIIAENIYSKMEQGIPSYQAAIEGTREMLKPILAITATTIIAFAPLTILPGIFGKVLGLIPVVVIFTMLASFIECILVLPGHLAFERTKKHSPNQPNARGWFEKLKNNYGKIITKFAYNPIKTLSISTVLILGLGVFSAMNTPFVFFPGAIEEISVNIEMPVSNSLQKSTVTIDEIEDAIRKSDANKNIREMISVVGYNIDADNQQKIRSHLGNIKIVFDPDMKISPEELIDIVNKTIGTISGVEKYEARQIRGGPPPGNPVEVSFYGSNLDMLNKIAQEFEQFLLATPNTTSVSSSVSDGKNELLVKVDPLLASISDITIASTAKSLRDVLSTTSQATIANSLDGESEDVDVIVRYPDQLTKKIGQDTDFLKETTVKNRFGYNVPLKNFSSIEEQNSFDLINKQDKKIFVSVSSQVKNAQDPDNSTIQLNKKSDDFLKGVVQSISFCNLRL